MSNDTSTPFPETAPVNDEAGIILMKIFTAVSSTLFICILWLILHESQGDYKSLFRPINILLICMCVMLLVSYACRYYSTTETFPMNDINVALPTFMAIYITGVLFEVCYVLSGWRRSDMVVKRLLPDYHLKLDIALRLTCILYVVAGFLQTLSNMMPLEQEDTSMMLNRIGIVMALAAILLMGCFDVFLLVCFMVFLNKTRFGLTTEPRFVIIARFGILGSLVYVSLPWIYFNALVLGNMESMTATPIIYLVLFLVMFVLKVFLYFDSKKESSSVKS